MTTRVRAVGVQYQMTSLNPRDMNRVVKQRLRDGKVEHKNPVRSLRDENLRAMIDVKALRRRRGKQIGFPNEIHQLTIKLRKPSIFQVGVIDE